MKKTYLLLSLLAFSNILLAQSSGTVQYKETTKVEIKVDGISEEMAAMIPKERSIKHELLFNEKNALLKVIKDEKSQDINHQTEGAKIVIKREEPDNKTYYDLNTMKCSDQKEFMGKKFLIESDLKSHTWKITGAQKEILGYACMEAELINPENKTDKIKVWFCPSLPYSIGPMALGNLPGLILVVDVNEGTTVINAEKIELGTINEKSIIKPNEGKKVSKKEFAEIVEMKRKEMQEQYGGDGNVIIKIRN